MNFLKHIFITLLVTLTVVSIYLTYHAIHIISTFKTLGQLIGFKYYEIGNIVATIGTLLIILAMCGWCVVFNKQYGTSMVFAAACVVMFICVLGIGIDVIKMTEPQWRQIKAELVRKFPLYGKNSEITKLFDDMQENLRCCGIQGPQDYQNSKIVLKFYLAPGPMFLPESCCDFTQISNLNNCMLGFTNSYSAGCGCRTAEIVGKHMKYLSYTCEALWVLLIMLAINSVFYGQFIKTHPIVL